MTAPRVSSVTASMFVAAVAMACASTSNQPDVFVAQENGKCASVVLGPSASGQSCHQAKDCMAACCPCAGSTNMWSAAVCDNQTCAANHCKASADPARRAGYCP